METTREAAVVYGEAEVFARTAHLFEGAEEIICAANDLNTWAWTSQRRSAMTHPSRLKHRARKLYRPGALIEPGRAEHVRELRRLGAEVRITTNEISETIVIDQRIAILAGDRASGERSYRVVTQLEVVLSVTSLFNAAWRAATELEVFDLRFAEVRVLAPRILDLLASGCKDETAARTLGLGLRTYRRRVAELMSALGATSRFQAGARARELGMV
ncbi:response regulator transcription factor [Amycolatopsis pithecellobii]|uniref:DNA-binding response regulator n=1 Tax=Amycolatopsis pithecellobii TaxID=664692 RepID=A0A6N7YXS5_9PSEU|nr:response regulator transcription factor [Amycolatopsis pithecellobii]MTD56708.1 DNA-binding response regulator [Amycolatopsis pithecellobii]